MPQRLKLPEEEAKTAKRNGKTNKKGLDLKNDCTVSAACKKAAGTRRRKRKTALKYEGYDNPYSVIARPPYYEELRLEASFGIARRGKTEILNGNTSEKRMENTG
jgi:hypothetical protein